MLLINCKTNVILTSFVDCVISAATEATNFSIAHTKLYVLAVIMSSIDNAI